MKTIISNLLEDHRFTIEEELSCCDSIQEKIELKNFDYFIRFKYFKNLDNVICFKTINNILHYQILYTFSCVVECCGHLTDSEIFLSKTKIIKKLKKLVYEQT